MTDPNATRRKHAAKRANEGIKLLAGTLNALGIGVAGAAFIIPGVASPALSFNPNVWFGFRSLGLHLAAQVALRFLRSED